ncbi:MAG: GNAT family N-acetyltransferase [Acidimicrobiales bacterium]
MRARSSTSEWLDPPCRAAAYDELVDRTGEVDRFCSSTDWIVPLHQNFGAGPVLAEVTPEAAVVLTRLPGRDRRALLCGLDVQWGFACPVVGPSVDAGVDLIERVLRDQRHDCQAVLLAGMVPDGTLASALARRLGSRLLVMGVGSTVGRRVAWLDGGLEAYLDRRSARFRRNARQAGDRAERAGIRFEWVDGGGADVVERAIAVEQASWKGRTGSGLADPSFARFYLDLAANLAAHPADAAATGSTGLPAVGGRLRAGFAVAGRQDVGYILGAVRRGRYRGLQLAYSSHFPALSLGNLLQLGQMERLVREGVTRYDLGMDMPYKVSWSDELFVTETLVART